MSHRYSGSTLLTVALLILISGTASAQSTSSGRSNSVPTIGKPLVTFIELGSVNCIPCKAMQPVMKAVEAKYGAQVKVIFYDVWTKQQAHYAKEYGVRLIPTQLFLDAKGKEFFRHEGFFPEEAIDDLFQRHGLKPRAKQPS